MEKWIAPNESEKRQRRVILWMFPQGSLLLLLYSQSLFNDMETVQAWGAVIFGVELIVLFLLLRLGLLSLRPVELIFYYSFVLFVFLIAARGVEDTSGNLPMDPYIFSATMSGLAMWICIVFLSSYLILPHAQNMVLVSITCGGFVLIAIYHLIFRDGFQIYYIFRWVNTLMGLGVVTLLIYYTGRLQRFYADNDMLTGVLNRRVAHDILRQECARAIRYKEMFSIISADLDRFKPINDTLGHATGDRVLREFTTLARQSIRDIDFLGRVGGDEFLIILPTASMENAALVAERIRVAVKEHDFQVSLSITASFGVAMFNDDQSLEEFLNRADLGLYDAKRQGGDRVAVR
jgi:diguanylate cyclase (GGDEF)-like protein